MLIAKKIFDIIYSKYNKDVFFEFSSSVYLKEFFMYISIKADLNITELCIPFLEINNIYSKLATENENLFNMINSDIVYNGGFPIKYNMVKYYYSDENIKIGQINLEKYIKNIFECDIMSIHIRQINLKVKFLGDIVDVKIFNNDKIFDLKQEIHEQFKVKNNILLNVNRIILTCKNILSHKNILNNDNTLDYYNIKDNSLLIVSINMNNNINAVKILI